VAANLASWRGRVGMLRISGVGSAAKHRHCLGCCLGPKSEPWTTSRPKGNHASLSSFLASELGSDKRFAHKGSSRNRINGSEKDHMIRSEE